MKNMIMNILNNVLHGPATRNYPYTKRKLSPNVKGRISGIDADQCIFCGICAKKCYPDAIKVDKENKIWALTVHQCILCGECVRLCPKKCIRMETEHALPSREVTTLFCRGKDSKDA